MAVCWMKIRKSSFKSENPFCHMAFCCATPVAINIKETFFVFMFFLFVLFFVRGRKVIIMIFLDLPSLLWWSWLYFTKLKHYDPVVKIHQKDTRRIQRRWGFGPSSKTRTNQIGHFLGILLFKWSRLQLLCPPFSVLLWIQFHTPVVRMQQRNNNSNRACDRRF